ncbi:MAG: hypothetical protein GY790_16220 [Bacteroidetes bacterium]|nr:hypothetical protein [Bacteroidota bacterium]
MKLHFTIWVILLSIFTPGFAIPHDHQIPEKGVLDLSNTVMDKNSLHNLNGEWEFYWKELLTPATYQKGKTNGEGIIVSVPSFWIDYEVKGKQLTGFGFGTYALTIILPPETKKTICIDIPVFDVTHKFFVNKRMVSENGIVGTSQETEQPWYEPGCFCYIPDQDTLRLLIQVSNFHHRRGGFWQPILIGGSDAILDRAERRRIYNYTTMGILFFFIVFFFISWLFYRKDSLTIFFSLTAIGMLIRSANTGLFVSNIFVDTSWVWQIRMEYFGSYLGCLFGVTCLHRMFPKKYMNPVITVNLIIFSLLIISIFTLPPSLFSYGMLVFQPLILLFTVHYLVLSLAGSLRGKLMDIIFFISLGLFIYTLVNDILVANSVGTSSRSYLSQISFQIFILAMSVLIIMQRAKNYKARIRLESSLSFKNKVLSVIAHDLKNPVASIAQFVDLIKAKPELVGKKEILSSLNESSQAAVSLLDNLLYWGRSQDDELKVSPIELELEKVVSQVKSLFTFIAEQKSVTLTSSVNPGTRVYADIDLINIIIRNLISNALKFTSAGGIITIDAQQEGEEVHISVSDTGIGIKPEILEQFMIEGQIVSSVGTDSELGTGLGLQLVSDLLARNHGILKVESTPGKGSTFTFTLPGEKQKTNNENQ